VTNWEGVVSFLEPLVHDHIFVTLAKTMGWYVLCGNEDFAITTITLDLWMFNIGFDIFALVVNFRLTNNGYVATLLLSCLKLQTL
jgi:hypothetical protein